MMSSTHPLAIAATTSLCSVLDMLLAQLDNEGVGRT